MTTRARAGLFGGVMLLGVVVAALLATCQGDEASPVPGVAESVEASPAAAGRRDARARRASPPTAAEGSPLDVRTSLVVGDGIPASGPADAAGQATDFVVRVTVTRDGRPVPDAIVALVRGEPIEAHAPWDAATAGVGSSAVPSDRAYFGLPRYLRIWSEFDPDTAGWRPEGPRTAWHSTDAQGRAEMRSLDGSRFRVVARGMTEPFVARPFVEVTPRRGEITEVSVEVRVARFVSGRCVDSLGRPLGGYRVQAVASTEDRPLSRAELTGERGKFFLQIEGDDPECRVRAVAPRAGRGALQLYESESSVPLVHGDAEVDAVVPGGAPIEVRIDAVPVVLLTVEAASEIGGLQLEGLVFDADAGAWGRLGGPAYASTPRADPRRAVAPVPRADAERPLLVWSWGHSFTAVDPRGRTHVAAALTLPRKIAVVGRGWAEGDRLRVVARVPVEGGELPVIWLEEHVGGCVEWRRDDAPPFPIEFRIVRGGRPVGPAASVPASAGDAPEVRIDL